jgi:hypothetical protein
MSEYFFDVKLFASFRINAENETKARQLLADALDCASVNFGADDSGDPLIAEASMDGEPDLIEIDGEEPSQ